MSGQTIQDIMNMRSEAMERNISICRAERVAKYISRIQGVNIITYPGHSNNYITTKNWAGYLKIYIYRETIHIYKFNNTRELVEEIKRDYRYDTDCIYSIIREYLR